MAVKNRKIVISYDLLCKVPGKTWTPQGSYTEAEYLAALSAAQEADSNGQWEAVRLMQVKSFGDDRKPLETIAWMSGVNISKGAGKGKTGGGAPSGGEEEPGNTDVSEDDEASPPPSGEPGPSASAAGRTPLSGGAPVKAKKAGDAYRKLARQALGQEERAEKLGDEPETKSKAGAIPRLLIVVALALAVAVPSPVLTHILVKIIVSSGVPMGEAIQDNIAIAGIGVFFLLALFLFGWVLLKEGDIDAIGEMMERLRNSGAHKEEEDDYAILDDGLNSWRDETAEASRASAPQQGGHAGPDDRLNSWRDGAAEESRADAPEENGVNKIPSDNEFMPAIDDPSDSPDTPPQSTKQTMMRFLQGALQNIKDHSSRLDKMSKFGLNLYLAGAGGQLAERQNVEGGQRKTLITEAIVAIGTKATMAGKFLNKIHVYEKDGKSKSMVDAGRSAMNHFMDGDENVFKELSKALDAFVSDKAAKASTQGVVILMFTDIVGSTALTQQLGDVGAQQVVRTHNAVVRNALAAYHGREVKQTGDGIMAVFSSAPNAIGATMVMQQELAKYNTNAGPQQCWIKIGLNAGEAVQEEGDFYGQAVQVSARICDKANAGQIFVTQSVKDLTQGHPIQFKDAGKFDLKGISEPVIAYEVIWDRQMAAAS